MFKTVLASLIDPEFEFHRNILENKIKQLKSNGGHLSVMYDQVPTKRSEIGEFCLKFNLPNHSLFIRRILICFKSKSIFDVFPEFKENFIKFNDGYPYLTNSNQCSKDQDFLEDDNIYKDDGGQCEYLDY